MMKKRILTLLLLLCVLGTLSVSVLAAMDERGVSPLAIRPVAWARALRIFATPTPTPAPTVDREENAPMPTLTVQVGTHRFTSTLEDNETTRAFVAS